MIFTPDGSSSGGSSAAGGASPAAPAGSAVGVMPGNAAGPGYGLGAASMDASTAVLLSSTSSSGGGGGSGNATARALLAASPAAAAGGSTPAAAAAPPRQLGFTVQTNSSVQWFKGQYQNPNTYIQASGGKLRPCFSYLRDGGRQLDVWLPWHQLLACAVLGAACHADLIGPAAPTSAPERSCPFKWRLSGRLCGTSPANAASGAARKSACRPGQSKLRAHHMLCAAMAPGGTALMTAARRGMCRLPPPLLSARYKGDTG